MLGLLAVCLALIVAYFVRHRSGDEVRFSHDVRPILNQNCMPCHGECARKMASRSYFEKRRWAQGNLASERLYPGGRMSRN